jgi:hypothetical protein
MTLKKPVGAVAELASLLKSITVDGQITDEEIAHIDEWLAAHPDCVLAPLELLRATSAAIRANGPISKEGRKAFHKAVEQVLPPDERRHSKAVRKARELTEQAKQKEERTTELAEKRAAKEKARADAAANRERNRPLFQANFPVRGVMHGNRRKVIRAFLEQGQPVVLRREPNNVHDKWAVLILVPHDGYNDDIGYVPREIAATLGPLMDKPHKYVAECSVILPDEPRVPIIDVKLYGPEADVGQPVTPAPNPAQYVWTSSTLSQSEATAQVRIQSPTTPRDTPPPLAQCHGGQQKRNIKPILLWMVLVVLIVILLGLTLRQAP